MPSSTTTASNRRPAGRARTHEGISSMRLASTPVRRLPAPGLGLRVRRLGQLRARGGEALGPGHGDGGWRDALAPTPHPVVHPLRDRARLKGPGILHEQPHQRQGVLAGKLAGRAGALGTVHLGIGDHAIGIGTRPLAFTPDQVVRARAQRPLGGLEQRGRGLERALVRRHRLDGLASQSHGRRLRGQDGTSAKNHTLRTRQQTNIHSTLDLPPTPRLRRQGGLYPHSMG